MPIHAPIEEDKRFIANYEGIDPIEARYASMIEAMDKSLGDLMDHIERLGIAENTIILFTSDNGGSVRLHAAECLIRTISRCRVAKVRHMKGAFENP
jgi:arylsulfatase A-like enzyme